MATILGSRYLEQMVFPYSFGEYLGARGVLNEKDRQSGQWRYGRLRDEIIRCFGEYLCWGGFPELLLFANKRHWLGSLYNKILLGDIVQRNRIKNEMAMRFVMKRIAENIKQPTSYNRITNVIKSTGVSTNTASVIEYIGYVRDACMVFSLDNYTSKSSERASVRKHYFIDNGLLNLFLTDGRTSLLENLCAIHLYRQYGERLFYYNKDIEVDFYIPDEELAIQASYSVSDEETFNREVAALSKLDSIHPLFRMQIITYEEETQIVLGNGKSIEVVPAWKWLLT